MRYAMLFIFGAMLVVGIGIGLWYFFTPAASPVPASSRAVPSATFPAAPGAAFHQNGATTTLTFEIPTTVDGVSVSVRDFRTDPSTIVDPTDLARFFLLDTASSTPFSIVYDSADPFFTITLNREPLGSLRQAAAENLMRLLGIGVDDACLLPFSVETASGTNAFYAGKNLGFSFCPGATALPQ